MTASARELIDQGALESAQEVLERAVSLDGGNGYAYLLLAYLHHVRGESARASELVSAARRHIPRSSAARGELEGLALSIRAASSGI